MSRTRIYMALYLAALNVAALIAWRLAYPHYEWAFPSAFWLLIIPFLLSIHYLFFEKGLQGKLNFSSIPSEIFERFSVLSFGPLIGFTLRYSAIWCIIVAIAQPQSRTDFESSELQGIDIVMSLDVSESMLAKDLRPNRLEAAKEVGQQFIDERPDDRIGLVVFQAEAFTQVPITTDHRVIKNALEDIRPGLLTSGTAIGMGLATAVNRIKDSEAKAKVIILLTDGMDNSGSIRPEDAASIAKTFGVRVYTIGVGTTGKALQPVAIDASGNYVFDWQDVQIDEDVLKKIAATTGGKYFRATSNDKLKAVYKEIDQMEKTKFQVSQFSRRHEEFWRFLIPGIALLLLELLMRNTLFRTTP